MVPICLSVLGDDLRDVVRDVDHPRVPVLPHHAQGALLLLHRELEAAELLVHLGILGPDVVADALQPPRHLGAQALLAQGREALGAQREEVLRRKARELLALKQAAHRQLPRRYFTQPASERQVPHRQVGEPTEQRREREGGDGKAASAVALRQHRPAAALGLRKKGLILGAAHLACVVRVVRHMARHRSINRPSRSSGFREVDRSTRGALGA
mmetsp:Transcript_35658/g.101641  ORF Transcript_35658/g.101641 Transcript_35658/m.101641 type:complete len:213 (+) Transcript_35658:653-1291(+)